MAKHISSMEDLEKALMPAMTKMMDQLAETVYETLNHFLKEYYDSYTPKSYQRTKDFLYSAVKVKPKVKGNKVVASVYIDTDALDNYYDATGEQVAEWANQGLHGGLDTGSKTPRVWDKTLDSTVNNGELLKQAVEYLRSKGFSVRS